MKLTHGVGNIDIVYTIGNQRKKGISLPKNESNQTDTFFVLLRCPRKGIDQAKENFLTSQLGAIQKIRDTLRGGGATISSNDTGEGGQPKCHLAFFCPFFN